MADTPTCRRHVADTTQSMSATLHDFGSPDTVSVSCRHDDYPTCRQKKQQHNNQIDDGSGNDGGGSDGDSGDEDDNGDGDDGDDYDGDGGQQHEHNNQIVHGRGEGMVR